MKMKNELRVEKARKQREYRRNNLETVKATEKRYRDKNRDRRNAYGRMYRAQKTLEKGMENREQLIRDLTKQQEALQGMKFAVNILKERFESFDKGAE
jgi:hypothetical protein